MEIKIENRKSHILVEVSQEFKPKDRKNIDEAIRVALEVFQEMKNTGVFKALVDARNVSAKADTWDRYFITSLLAKEYISFMLKNKTPLMKIVFVADRSLIDSRKFGETVSHNLGAESLVTHDMQEALKWLGVEASP